MEMVLFIPVSKMNQGKTPTVQDVSHYLSGRDLVGVDDVGQRAAGRLALRAAGLVGLR